jgi:hypothetical protein
MNKNTITTPVGVAKYPHLNKPDKKYATKEAGVAVTISNYP